MNIKIREDSTRNYTYNEMCGIPGIYEATIINTSYIFISDGFNNVILINKDRKQFSRALEYWKNETFKRVNTVITLSNKQLS